MEVFGRLGFIDFHDLLKTAIPVGTVQNLKEQLKRKVVI